MSEYFIINCGKKLGGEITISVSKNAALKILAASILTSQPVKIPKLPEIEDIGRMKELMLDLGVLFSNGIVDSSKIKKLEVLLTLLKKAGANLEVGSDYVIVNPARNLRAIDVKTREYPGFATDLQAPLGANIITADPHRVIIQGPSKLRAKKIYSPDIRAGMALIIAALLAEGQSVVDNIYQIDRCYEKIDEKLKSLGADIKRIKV